MRCGCCAGLDHLRLSARPATRLLPVPRTISSVSQPIKRRQSRQNYRRVKAALRRAGVRLWLSVSAHGDGDGGGDCAHNAAVVVLSGILPCPSLHTGWS